MSILFHPEVPFAFLCALAILIFLRAARLGWPTRLGWLLGGACGAAVLTRQPAALLVVCLAQRGARAGRAARARLPAARRDPDRADRRPLVGVCELPLAQPAPVEPRSSRRRRCSPSEPASFYLSAPLASLVLHPYRPRLRQPLLPKLHGDLWSDWYGALERQWLAPTRVERVTASSQSVLGFLGDALALAGLAALAIPAAVRAARRRAARRAGWPTELGLGLLACVALAAFAAFVVTVIRFPQRGGDPIKSSYLLFTAPCWAVFSVAAWAEVRRALAEAERAPGRGRGALPRELRDRSRRRARADQPAVGNLGQLRNVVDLSTFFQKNSPNPGIGGPVELLVGVNENGGQDATNVTLTVELSPAMRLLGQPYVVQGSCGTTAPIHCQLGEIPGGQSAYIRFSVDVNAGGPQNASRRRHLRASPTSTRKTTQAATPSTSGHRRAAGELPGAARRQGKRDEEGR